MSSFDHNSRSPAESSASKAFFAKGLIKTRSFFEKIGLRKTQWGTAEIHACEEALIQADFGVKSAMMMSDTLIALPNKNLPFREALFDILLARLKPLEAIDTDHVIDHKPTVILLAGINGAGKTTTIAKLTHHFAAQNKSIVLAAADTFRAAAREQLKHWGEHHGVRVIEQQSDDPAAVAFDTIKSAQATGKDIAMIDTAGRLTTQKHLMAELSRILKVSAKSMDNAPHHRWLVIDGTQGQNTLSQIEAFHAVMPLTGLIVTKLDGSAKAGFLLGIAEKFKIPVRYIGCGEKPEDLQRFVAKDFIEGLLGDVLTDK